MNVTLFCETSVCNGVEHCVVGLMRRDCPAVDSEVHPGYYHLSL